MRFLVKVKPDLERTNQSLQDGSFGKRMETMISELKPEAAYFFEEDGQRTAIFVVDIPEASQMPRVGEMFYHLNARVHFHPAMTAQDLANANLDQLAKRWSAGV